MSLDSYLFQIRKCTKQELDILENRDLASIEHTFCGYKVWPADDLDAHADLCLDLFPFLSSVNCYVKEINWAQIRLDNEIPEDDEICFVGNRVCNGDKVLEYGFFGGKSICLTERELDLYTSCALKPCFAVAIEQVGYWHNEYKLHDSICSAVFADRVAQAIISGQKMTREETDLLAVRNCGYYELTSEIVDQIKSMVEENELDPVHEADPFFRCFW